MALGSIQAIEETGQILNPKNLEKAIEAIDSAERVYFFWSRCFIDCGLRCSI